MKWRNSFFKKNHELSKLTQEEIENLNSLVIRKKGFP
jgi:hypothetical protein